MKNIVILMLLVGSMALGQTAPAAAPTGMELYRERQSRLRMLGTPWTAAELLDIEQYPKPFALVSPGEPRAG
jgi:hypothetical protein